MSPLGVEGLWFGVVLVHCSYDVMAVRPGNQRKLGHQCGVDIKTSHFYLKEGVEGWRSGFSELKSHYPIRWWSDPGFFFTKLAFGRVHNRGT